MGVYSLGGNFYNCNAGNNYCAGYTMISVTNGSTVTCSFPSGQQQQQNRPINPMTINMLNQQFNYGARGTTVL
jgi:hypothetical protein